ncbi:MAG: Minf_1886 family protein, partial [candidate division WOR-3 bacterium]
MEIEEIISRDPRYRLEAYAFVQEALRYTQKALGKKGHVSGQELCNGCRRLAIKLYGRLAKTVLNSWGLYATDDFGNVVYNLIAAGL